MHSRKQMKHWQLWGLLLKPSLQSASAGPAHPGETLEKCSQLTNPTENTYTSAAFFPAGFTHTLPFILNTPRRITFLKVSSILHRTVGLPDIFYRIWYYNSQTDVMTVPFYGERALKYRVQQEAHMPQEKQSFKNKDVNRITVTWPHGNGWRCRLLQLYFLSYLYQIWLTFTPFNSLCPGVGLCHVLKLHSTNYEH